MRRLIILLILVARLRRPELRSAITWVRKMYPGKQLSVRLGRFAWWALRTMWKTIPDALSWMQYDRPVSRIPLWLEDENPLLDHPWRAQPQATLPAAAEVVVIGAGFVGAGAAYHWSRHAGSSRHGPAKMVVLEMHDAASGAGGRNAGYVTRGRYYHFVHGTVLAHLRRTRHDLAAPQRLALAHDYARTYVRAGERSAELIEQTVVNERIDCGYAKRGWVWATDEESKAKPLAAQQMGAAAGFTDWVRINAAEAMQRAGIHTGYDAGYSQGTATWHPAKWIWGLLRVALRTPHVELFTRTRVTAVEDAGETYQVKTERGTIAARYVINATESHTAQLFKELRGANVPYQTQAAWGPSVGGTMKAGVGISSPQMFFGGVRGGVLFGSDLSPVSAAEAGQNRPSRFVSHYVAGSLRRFFSIERLRVTNEWSGTVGIAPDEYPLIGLMDDKRLYMVGGLAGSGSGVSFLATQWVVFQILGKDCPDYYPQQYFSPRRFQQRR